MHSVQAGSRRRFTEIKGADSEWRVYLYSFWLCHERVYDKYLEQFLMTWIWIWHSSLFCDLESTSVCTVNIDSNIYTFSSLARAFLLYRISHELSHEGQCMSPRIVTTRESLSFFCFTLSDLARVQSICSVRDLRQRKHTVYDLLRQILRYLVNRSMLTFYPNTITFLTECDNARSCGPL